MVLNISDYFDSNIARATNTKRSTKIKRCAHERTVLHHVFCIDTWLLSLRSPAPPAVDVFSLSPVKYKRTITFRWVSRREPQNDSGELRFDAPFPPDDGVAVPEAFAPAMAVVVGGVAFDLVRIDVT